MSAKKIILLMASFVCLAAVVYAVAAGRYPVIFVGWSIVSAENFNKNYSAALNYYKNSIKVYSGDSALLDSGEVRMEIKRAVAENLIENALINNELSKELSLSEIQRIIDKKISEAINGRKIDKAVQALYGFSSDGFIENVLIPMAKKEIFEGRLFLKGQNFGDAMKEIKSKAKVMIFIPEFEWDGNGVIIK